MKRDDVTKVFPEATKEQIDMLLNIASGDIGRFRTERDELQNRVEQMQAQIDAMKQNTDDVEKLKAQLADFESKEKERAEADAAKAARAELEERFGKAAGDRKFIHDMVREGVMQDFARAIADKENTGKADAEIFNAITLDKGYFAGQNEPSVSMPEIGTIGTGDDHMAAVRHAMGLPPMS